MGEQIKVWAYRTVHPADVLIGQLYETSQPPVLGSAAAVELPIKGLSFADGIAKFQRWSRGQWLELTLNHISHPS